MAPRRHNARTAGFTLIELVVTLAIIGLIATAAMPLASVAMKREKETQLRSALREIRSAIDAYKVAGEQGRIQIEADKSGFPPTLAVLVEGVDDASKAQAGSKIYFLRRLPRDPFFPDAHATAAETWGLRSYESEPDNPQPGDNVYDVYSLSADKGLNGIQYHDW